MKPREKPATSASASATSGKIGCWWVRSTQNVFSACAACGLTVSATSSPPGRSALARELRRSATSASRGRCSITWIAMIAPSDCRRGSDSRCAIASPTATSSPRARACARPCPSSTSTPRASIPARREHLEQLAAAAADVEHRARGPAAARRTARPARATRSREPRKTSSKRAVGVAALRRLRLAAEPEHAAGDARRSKCSNGVARDERHRARAGHQLVELALVAQPASRSPPARAGRAAPPGARESRRGVAERGRARASRACSRACAARSACSSSASRRTAAASASSSARSDAV